MSDAPERIWVAAWREGDWSEGDWDDNEGKTLNDKPCIEYVRTDRIEALTKERDEADDLAKAAFADGASNNIRLAETSYRVKWLEAKLAKAVEALEKIAGAADREWTTARCGGLCDIARATLAEIKGESHD